MAALMAAGAVAQGLGSLFNIWQGAKMMKEAKKINPDYYSINDSRMKGMESEYAKSMLGRAQMQVNARSPLAAVRERSIMAGTASTQSNILRGVVDPTMAMQGFLAAQKQGQANMDDQFAMEANMQQAAENRLINAQGTMISERDKILAEKMNKYQMDMSQKNALRSAGQQSISSGFSSLAGTLMGAGQMGQSQKNFNTQMDLTKQIYGIG